LSTRVGSVVGRADAALYTAHSQLARGEFTEARANLSAARTLIEKLGPEHRLRTGLGLAEFILAYFTGEAPEQWVTDVATSRTPPWMTPITLGITTLATVHQGDRDRAEELLEVLVPLLTQFDPTTVNNNAATALAAEVAWELNSIECAEPLRDVARSIIARGVGDYTLTSNELAVARMAALLGDRDQSAAFFERARNVLAAEDRRPLLAIVERDEARSKLHRR